MNYKEQQCGTGGLYRLTAKNGTKFLSGNIIISGPGTSQKYHVNIWPNNEKKKIKDPDVKVFIYPLSEKENQQDSDEI